MKTPVLENAPPELWHHHKFGLPDKYWARLNGKRFWVTGAGTGYGRAIACGLAATGAKVVLSGRRMFKLQETIDEMKRYGIDPDLAICSPVDLSSEEEIIQACKELEINNLFLNGIIHSAALPSKPGCRFPLAKNLVSDWEQIINVNVRAPWLLSRIALGSLFKYGDVKNLLITSEAGWAGTTGFGLYNVSKAALNNLGQSMASEFAEKFPEKEIQVNVLSPGEACTEMNQGSDVSPFTIVSMTLLLMSQFEGGPNGCFFHRDGRHLSCGHAKPFMSPLI